MNLDSDSSCFFQSVFNVFGESYHFIKKHGVASWILGTSSEQKKEELINKALRKKFRNKGASDAALWPYLPTC